MEKLERHPELLAAVLSLLDGWIRNEELRASRIGLEQWRQMLTRWPFEKVRALLLDPERGQVLRQCSPLGPVLTPRERWRAFPDSSWNEYP